MRAEDLFTRTETEPGARHGVGPAAFRWSESTEHLEVASDALGASARIWRSAVSGKLVLTVEFADGVAVVGRIASIEEGHQRAEEWLADGIAERGRTRRG